ncbi:hypothetical protein ACQZV8_21280, partial [Magnetococcales bacterium HHB-1]
MKFLKNATLKKQIMTLVSVLMVLLSLVAGSGVLALKQIGTELHELSDENFPLYRSVSEVMTDQLEQLILIEKLQALVEMRHVTEKDRATIVSVETVFNTLSDEVANDMKAVMRAAGGGKAAEHTKHGKNKHEKVVKDLKEIHNRYSQFQQSAKTFIGLMKQERMDEALTL